MKETPKSPLAHFLLAPSDSVFFGPVHLGIFVQQHLLTVPVPVTPEPLVH